MCGRFTLIQPEEVDLIDEIEDLPEEMKPRYNIAPSQPVLVIRPDSSTGGLTAGMLVWGLIPSWADDRRIGARLINARSETVAEKPSFRGAFRQRRCLIPADGFYEWQSITGSREKRPHYIRRPDARVFLFAGLWERWSPKAGGAAVESCTILTTEANERIRSIHNRMPVILSAGAGRRWIDPNQTHPDSLRDLLQPVASESLIATPVSRHVNRPANDDPSCISPHE
ncbi:MAG: SOS response-associated peptidase [Phycisphaerae bacterium]